MQSNLIKGIASLCLAAAVAIPLAVSAHPASPTPTPVPLPKIYTPGLTLPVKVSPEHISAVSKTHAALEKSLADAISEMKTEEKRMLLLAPTDAKAAAAAKACTELLAMYDSMQKTLNSAKAKQEEYLADIK